jgi:hypothetical protein
MTLSLTVPAQISKDLLAHRDGLNIEFVREPSLQLPQSKRPVP